MENMLLRSKRQHQTTTIHMNVSIKSSSYSFVNLRSLIVPDLPRIGVMSSVLSNSRTGLSKSLAYLFRKNKESDLRKPIAGLARRMGILLTVRRCPT